MNFLYFLQYNLPYFIKNNYSLIIDNIFCDVNNYYLYHYSGLKPTFTN